MLLLPNAPQHTYNAATAAKSNQSPNKQKLVMSNPSSMGNGPCTGHWRKLLVNDRTRGLAVGKVPVFVIQTCIVQQLMRTTYRGVEQVMGGLPGSVNPPP